MKYDINDSYFEKIDSFDKAYWLGFLYADGCVRECGALEVGLKYDDIDHLKKFKESLSSKHPIKEKIINKKYKSCRIQIGCKKMVNDLINLNCLPRKSLILSFPDKVVPNEFMSHFIRGYFDGDGGVHYAEHNYFHKSKGKSYIRYKCVCYFSGNFKFLTDLKMFLENNGVVVSKVYSDKRSNNYSIEINGKDNVKQFYNYIYNDCLDFKLDRKFNKFYDIINNKDLKINQVRPSKTGENR